ncbi:TM2 domain-containing protein [Selenomonas ruminantium]|uniref:TM2 domain-containing protein n=1 Tax=Selenomonas ruminantium TaxID=971 RepID=A0A1M6TDC5_SELRU|nr:5-bromo-4-chloroindolyl phosphate hydrolysis family protein [Selenomonas ruminantium]SHK54963.1 TM2 domain-containing protein [Selenomonas ruminantium]
MRNICGLLALILGIGGIYCLTNDYGAAGLLMLVGMGASIYRGQLPQKVVRKLDVSQLADAQADSALEDWEKARLDYERVETARRKIRDSQLSQQLGLMQQEAARLLNYVEKHPERIAAANRFIHYYQDRAANLSEQYMELEDTKLETGQVRQVKAQLKETLVSFDEAYSAEFTKIINNQLLDMEAELTVMKQSLEAEGISNNRQEMSGEPVELNAHSGPPATGIGRKKRPRRGAVTKVGRQGLEPVPEKMPVPDNLRNSVLMQKLIMSGLAIALGTLGAHKFYQGKTKWGVAYIVLCWTLIPTFVSIIEGIRYFFMPVDDFYEQYYR